MSVLKPTLYEKSLLKSGILEEFWPLSLDDYAGNTAPLESVKTYIRQLSTAREQGIGLFLYGTNGTGKTMLAVCVLKAALAKGFSAQMTSLGGVIQMLTDGWHEPEKRRAFEARVRDVDFLLIDDIGKEYRAGSGFTEMAFDNLIRYRTFRNKPILLTTNADSESVASVYGKSLMSLLQGKFLPVQFIDTDYRRTKLASTVKERLMGPDKKDGSEVQ